VRALKDAADVRAVCLVGSVARGDARPDSDLDLVVVSDRPVRELAAHLPAAAPGDRISLICRTPDQICEMALTGSLFLYHVRTEGKVLYDPDRFLARIFDIADKVPLDPKGEIRRRAAGLRHYRHLERFGDRYQFALADLYAIAKSIAVAWCATLDRPTFVKSDALANVAAHRPDLHADIATITRLRPFYDMSRGHGGQRLPFDPVGARAEVERAVDAVSRLADAAP
jgi:Nucleotidyltransferase domain